MNFIVLCDELFQLFQLYVAKYTWILSYVHFSTYNIKLQSINLNKHRQKHVTCFCLLAASVSYTKEVHHITSFNTLIPQTLWQIWMTEHSVFMAWTWRAQSVHCCWNIYTWNVEFQFISGLWSFSMHHCTKIRKSWRNFVNKCNIFGSQRDVHVLECYPVLTGKFPHLKGQAGTICLWLFAPDNEGTTLLRNISKYLSVFLA